MAAPDRVLVKFELTAVCTLAVSLHSELSSRALLSRALFLSCVSLSHLKEDRVALVLVSDVCGNGVSRLVSNSLVWLRLALNSWFFLPLLPKG